MSSQTGEEFLNIFEVWYEKNFIALFNFVSFYVHDVNGAEDLTALIFEKALQKQKQYDPDKGTLSNWVYGIARNSIKLFFREQDYKKKLIKSLVLIENIQLYKNINNPEEVLEKKESFLIIINHIYSLSEKEQNVLALRYGAGLSYKEIAKQLNIKRSMVGVTLHRAHKTIKAIIVLEKAKK